MSLKHLVLQNFRNYSKLELDFKKRTLFFGLNTQGKTNILEAIYILSTLKSFRGPDEILIKEGEDFLSIEGEVDFSLKVVIQKNKGEIKKTVLKKGRKVSAQKFLESFSAVIFSPEDVGFILAAPSFRRRYIDVILCKTDRNYTYNLLNYKRTLIQRNNLLKSIKDQRAREGELDIWDNKISEYGNYIIQKRKGLISEINLKISSFYKKITGDDKETFIDYITQEEDIEEALKRYRTKDIQTGVTNVGPQRDDIVFKDEKGDIRNFASRGDFRTIILALKLCEGEYLTEKLRQDVTYLFDDVFSELDKERRKNLLETTKEKQIVLTTTDLDHVTKEFLDKTDVYKISGGKVFRQ